MAYEFGSKAGKRRNTGGGQALDDKNMAARVAQERKRMLHATDSEFWLCLCFKREADKAAFLAKTGLPDKKFISGRTLRAAVAEYKPDKPPKVFAKRTRGALKANDPLADVGMSTSMEADCKTEVNAILDAFRAVDLHDEYREASDSHIWICAAFYDREDVEGFLDEYGLRKHGDKYIDASGWLKQLG